MFLWGAYAGCGPAYGQYPPLSGAAPVHHQPCPGRCDPGQCRLFALIGGDQGSDGDSEEDYCPQCGALLEGETTCPECGIDVESYMDNKEKIKTKKAIEEVDQLKESDEEEDIFENDETQQEE